MDCGIIACMEDRCECFNKTEKPIMPKAKNKYTSIDYLMGNKYFVEVYKRVIKEADTLKQDELCSCGSPAHTGYDGYCSDCG